MHRRYLDRLGTLGRAHYPAAQHWNREVKQNFAQAGIGLAHLDHLRLVYGVKEKKAEAARKAGYAYEATRCGSIVEPGREVETASIKCALLQEL